MKMTNDHESQAPKNVVVSRIIYKFEKRQKGSTAQLEERKYLHTKRAAFHGIAHDKFYLLAWQLCL